MQPVLGSFMLYLPELEQKPTPDDVLDFWFGALDEDGQATLEEKAWLWWGKADETDLLIKSRFGPLVEEIANGLHNDWLATAKGRMAAIIVLDQYPRNIFRGEARAFAYDAQAQQICTEGIEGGVDRNLPLIQRVFFYLPLEHAEEREKQVQSVQMYDQLVAEASDENKETYATYLDYAIRHKVIIDRFGHYPHRNAILERASNPEEVAFLEEPGSSFL